MPAIELKTNVKVADPKAFTLELSKLVAQNFEYSSDEYISVNYNYQEYLTFSGTFEPAFIFSMMAIDKFSPENNVRYSKSFADFFLKKLGVPADRGFMVFRDPGKDSVGYNSETLTQFYAKLRN